jgi:hypothetical protein
MTSSKYIGIDAHKESISIAGEEGAGKIVMECVIRLSHLGKPGDFLQLLRTLFSAAEYVDRPGANGDDRHQ